MCGNQQVHKTPSINIVVAMNELAKLPQSPALDTVTTYLKAATVQVNDNQLGDKRLLLPWLLVTAVVPIAPG
jgi:hypothetical protein